MPDSSRDSLLTLASDVRLACQHVSRRVRYDNPHEVAPHQFSVLAKLRPGPRTPGELAQIEEISAPSMTRTLNGLVEAGLVARRPHPTDGRCQMVELTDEGHAVIERTRASRDDWMIQRLAALSDSELAVLRRATDILAKVIHQ